MFENRLFEREIPAELLVVNSHGYHRKYKVSPTFFTKTITIFTKLFSKNASMLCLKTQCHKRVEK